MHSRDVSVFEARLFEEGSICLTNFPNHFRTYKKNTKILRIVGIETSFFLISAILFFFKYVIFPSSVFKSVTIYVIPKMGPNFDDVQQKAQKC